MPRVRTLLQMQKVPILRVLILMQKDMVLMPRVGALLQKECINMFKEDIIKKIYVILMLL